MPDCSQHADSTLKRSRASATSRSWAVVRSKAAQKDRTELIVNDSRRRSSDRIARRQRRAAQMNEPYLFADAAEPVDRASPPAFQTPSR